MIWHHHLSVSAALLTALFTAAEHRPPVQGPGHELHSEEAVLARARESRGLRAFGARAVALEYQYVPSWAADKVGTLRLEFQQPGTYARDEFFPWQRMTTANNRLDKSRFSRTYGDGVQKIAGENPSAESSLRAMAFTDWMIQMHEAPDWVTPVFLPVSETERARFRSSDVIRVNGANVSLLMVFDRADGRLQQVLQHGTRTTGAPTPEAQPVVLQMSVGSYQRFNGAWFPTEVRSSFIGAPSTFKDNNVSLRLVRVTY